MKKIPLTKGKFALVDDEDFERLSQFKWHYGKGYAARKTNEDYIYMHKEILGIGKKQEGDHKNGDKLNNQRANLRTCTHAQNMFNRRTQKNNVSGVSGVS